MPNFVLYNKIYQIKMI